jgi:hypothetical protein
MNDENLSTHKSPAVPDEMILRRSDEAGAAKEAVVRIVSTKPSRSEYALPQPPVRKDWASAIELVNEACEAIRLAEEKASAAER